MAAKQSTITEVEMDLMLSECYDKLFTNSNCAYLQNAVITDHEGTYYRLHKPKIIENKDGSTKELFMVNILTTKFQIASNQNLARSLVTPTEMERHKMNILQDILRRWNGMDSCPKHADFNLMLAQVNDYLPLADGKGLKRRRKILIFED